MNWPIRKPMVPTTCNGLDLGVIERALIEARGNVTAAARALSVPSGDLRKLVWASPSLAAAVYEQIEQGIDTAQGVLFEALRSKDASLRRQAAAFLLSHSEAARRRGWGRRERLRDQRDEAPEVTFRWTEPGDA
jgi:hypothetical protein